MIKKYLRDLHITIDKSTNYKWWALAVIQFGIFFVGIGATIVNIALPSISKAFDLQISAAQWVIVMYALTMAVMLPIAGKTPQYFGRKKVVIAGFIIFTLGSILAALSPSFDILLISQVFLALGSAALLANSNVITYFVFPKEQHGFAMGINGTVASIGYGVGLILGGYLVKKFGWSSIYWLNIPFGLFGIFLASIVLVENKIRESASPPSSFDFIGAILFTVFMSCTMLILNGQFSNELRIYFAIGSISCLGFFILREFTALAPLIDMRLFKIHSFSIGVFLRLLITVISSSCLFFIPLFAQYNLQLNSSQSGLIMAPFSVALFIFGPLAGKLSDRIGFRWITTCGFLLSVMALFVLSTLHAPHSYKIPLAMFFLGGGIGFFVPSNNSSSINAVPPLHVGFVSGILWSPAEGDSQCVGLVCWLERPLLPTKT